MKVPTEVMHLAARLKVGKNLMSNSQPELSLSSTSCCGWSVVEHLISGPSCAAQQFLGTDEFHLIDLLMIAGKPQWRKHVRKE